MASDPNPSRRRLLLYTLGGTTAVTAGLIGFDEWRSRNEKVFTAAPRPPDRAPYLSPTGVMTRRRRLGRTGLQVSVVGIGAGSLEGTGPIHRAAAKGINYIDTASCYGGSENVIGNAFRESAHLRNDLILATKWDAGARMPKERMLESLDESLKRLRTDHVDILQIHNLGNHPGQPGDDGFNRLDNPELYAAMDAAKSAGKVRFFGATAHTGNRTDILMHAIDKGAFDMLLVKMNVLDFETANIPKLLQHAKAKDVGVIAMKSQPNGGMMPPGFEKSKWNAYQANLRWTLSQDIACVLHSAVGTDEAVQDAAVGAVHDELTMNDPVENEFLEKYATALSPHYCRACKDAACVSACPDEVDIPTVLRAVMYDRHYGWPQQARETYRALGQAGWSERCLSCSECDSACPYGVDASSRVREARSKLG
jgi:predicted aldo/keto reductase-like oxidoreductase